MNALRCQQFWMHELQPMTHDTFSLPQLELMDFMRQRCGLSASPGSERQGSATLPPRAARGGPPCMPPALPSSLPLRPQMLCSPPPPPCRGLTTAAADDVLGRLERSGMVLTLAGTVILRPGEVAEALSLVRR